MPQRDQMPRLGDALGAAAIGLSPFIFCWIVEGFGLWGSW